jgi:hypothetical protein
MNYFKLINIIYGLLSRSQVGNNPLARVEAYDGQTWKYNAVKSLPVPVYLHCLVHISKSFNFLYNRIFALYSNMG